MTTEPEHHHTPEEERKIREAALDETLAETFPASDPPSTIPNCLRGASLRTFVPLSWDTRHASYRP